MGLMDYTTFIEVDPNNKITVTANLITMDAYLNRNVDAYIYKDMGIGYFNGNYVFNVDILWYGGSGGTRQQWVWALSNDIASFNEQNNMIGILLRGLGPNYERDICISVKENGVERISSYYPIYPSVLTANVWYYLIISKIGSTLNLKIYSNSERTNLLADLSLSNIATTAWRYLYAFMNWHMMGGVDTDMRSKMANLNFVSISRPRRGYIQTFSAIGSDGIAYKQSFKSDSDYNEQMDRSLPDSISKNQTWGEEE